MKLLHPLLYFLLAEPRTNLYRESFAMLKFKVYSCFFKLTSCVAGQEWSSVTSKKIRHKKLAVIGCYCKTWKQWTTNNAFEPKKRLSFIDDWRRCCCSWPKKRGVASMGRGHQVFSQKTVQTFPFYFLKLSACSNRCESSYFTFDALHFLLTMSLALTLFFISHHLFFNQM